MSLLKRVNAESIYWIVMIDIMSPGGLDLPQGCQVIYSWQSVDGWGVGIGHTNVFPASAVALLTRGNPGCGGQRASSFLRRSQQ